MAAPVDCAIKDCWRQLCIARKLAIMPTSSKKAASLWESLAQNHPFIDGNKRTAFAVTYTFLAINGTRITADADATFSFIIDLHESGTFELGRLTTWLRSNISHDG